VLKRRKNPSTNPSAATSGHQWQPSVNDLTTPDLPTGVKETVSRIERASESQATPTLNSNTINVSNKNGTKRCKGAKDADSVKHIRDKNTGTSTSQWRHRCQYDKKMVIDFTIMLMIQHRLMQLQNGRLLSKARNNPLRDPYGDLSSGSQRPVLKKILEGDLSQTGKLE
jgi:hypothetical protein